MPPLVAARGVPDQLALLMEESPANVPSPVTEVEAMVMLVLLTPVISPNWLVVKTGTEEAEP